MQSPIRFWSIIFLLGLVVLSPSLINCRAVNFLEFREVYSDYKDVNQIETGKQILATIQSNPCIEDIVFGVPEDSWRCQPSDSLTHEIPEENQIPVTEAIELGDAFKNITKINWDQAEMHIGELISVCGPIVSSHFADSTNGQPTFLNIGKEYPDPQRFTILIWGQDLDRFPFNPDEYYFGKNICVSGTIQEYQGSLEIEVAHPNQIEVQN